MRNLASNGFVREWSAQDVLRVMILGAVALYHLKENAGTERYEESKDEVTVDADGSVDLYFGLNNIELVK